MGILCSNYDRNIRCNAVSPGGIFNPENPQSKEFINNYSINKL